MPTDLLNLVKDNVIVQWALVLAVVLGIATNTAAKLKGPLGAAARWFQRFGEARAEREAIERRALRQRLLEQATEGNEYVLTELASLRAKVEELLVHGEALERLIRQHLGWDYERVQQLIQLGVRPGEIPTPPPLRVPWGTPSRTNRSDAPEDSLLT